MLGKSQIAEIRPTGLGHQVCPSGAIRIEKLYE